MKKIYLFVLLFISCDDPNQSGQQEDFIPIDEYFIYSESNMIAFYFFENIFLYLVLSLAFKNKQV